MYSFVKLLLSGINLWGFTERTTALKALHVVCLHVQVLKITL